MPGTQEEFPLAEVGSNIVHIRCTLERDLGSHCERIEPGAGIIEVGWAHLLDDVAVKVVEHQSDVAIRLAGCRRQFGSVKRSRRMLTRHSFKVARGHKPRLWKSPVLAQGGHSPKWAMVSRLKRCRPFHRQPSVRRAQSSPWAMRHRMASCRHVT
jgi:hypothetical protein